MAQSLSHVESASRPNRLGRSASIAVAASVLALIALAPPGNEVQAAGPSKASSRSLTLVIPSMASPLATPQLLRALNELVARSPMTLTAAIETQVQQSGGSAGVSLMEIGGTTPFEWSFDGDEVFTAASTYKLAVLMMEAQNIASGKTSAGGSVCFQDADYEAGWYHDYEPGACFTRTELARRAGQMSDNTAGHMLVRDVGGPDVLNAWAASVGTKESVFFTNNTTSANDLAALWAAEARGSLGGTHAQSWLYPVLTGTKTEAGIPAGVAGRSVVVHKTGTLDRIDNDAALVQSGPNGPYVLSVMTDGLGGSGGWALIASIASTVWNFEFARAG